MSPENSLGKPIGPIFVVGMSRSGTKLLRAILDRHPTIKMLDFESAFIPLAIKKFASRGQKPNPQSRASFKRFLNNAEFSHTLQRKKRLYSVEELERILGQNDWQAIISALMHYATGADRATQVWGDKTPRYVKHMASLKQFFPSARFLHICRDPRDRSLSVINAWGGNVLICAQQWLDWELLARRQAKDLGEHYHCISYENLTNNPQTVVEGICTFLGIEFFTDMLVFDRPLENRGDPNRLTRTKAQVVADNSGRFVDELSPRQLQRLEQIVFPFAESLGYQPTFLNQRHKPLGQLEKLYYGAPHYFSNLTFFANKWGPVRGVKHAYQRWRL